MKTKRLNIFVNYVKYMIRNTDIDTNHCTLICVQFANHIISNNLSAMYSTSFNWILINTFLVLYVSTNLICYLINI